MSWQQASRNQIPNPAATSILIPMPQQPIKQTALPATLGQLRTSEYTPEKVARSVKDELRDNLIARLRANAGKDTPLFPGIVGYDDTVIPQIVNAVLSRHNFILLGLRGQAKSRILRALTTLLDPYCPYVAGSELRDNPYAPLSKVLPRPDRKARRRYAHRLDDAGRSLRRKARHAGRHRRRPDRRRRPHQGRALRTGARLRAHHALRPAAPRQPRHLRHQRSPRSCRQNPGRALQHHAGRRRAD